jgi:nucleoid-associated protein YgaU
VTLAVGRTGKENIMSSGDEDEKEPDFSDVESGSSSTAPAPVNEAVTRTYTIVAGDSLSKIAKKIYGDANRWKEIFEANKDTIKNPDLIHPGQVVKIPGA